MLSDIERKVMRIIMNNYRLKGRIPPISELQFRTGRTKDGIYAVLKTLNEQQLDCDGDKEYISLKDLLSISAY